MSADALQLVGGLKRKGADLEKCIICQKVKRSETLTTTENGRSKISAASSLLQDGLLSNLNQDEIALIKYHLKECYKPYVLRSQRVTAAAVQENDMIDTGPVRSKRRKTEECVNKTCIICNQTKFKGDVELYRISEAKRAQMFLCAIKLNLDVVYTRCSTYKTKEHIFAADIMSHRNCMKRYLLQYQRKVEDIIYYDDLDTDSDDETQEAFKAMLAEIQLDKNGYAVSTCRDILNQHLEGYQISNRKVKQMLIKHFGEEICFTYPRDRNKSQMLFSTSICSADVIETLRSSDPVKYCAEKLREECEEFDFLLENSYCDAKDLALSLNQYKQNRPKLWDLFFNTLFPFRKKSDHIKRKCDNIFQIVFNLVHNGKNRTPMHVSIAQAIHDVCRSKQLIQIFNHMGFCNSYDEVERIDSALAQRTIDRAGINHVPVPPSIHPCVLIQGAMDNFDHEENTQSGIGGSHDTILMLFQNPDGGTEDEVHQISTKPSTSVDARTLHEVLACQTLVRVGKFVGRGEIPTNFLPGTPDEKQDIEFSANADFTTWMTARFITKANVPKYSSCEKPCIPSFTATSSLLVNKHHSLTRIGFTPIIPYPATEFDTINTCMKNFQDVLFQKNLPNGPLWCDEGVYRIAKELQLLKPKEFGNIFLGLGGFHMEKIFIACLGKFLEESGVNSVFVENEIFGPVVVNSVMNGGHYIRGKHGMALISEALHRLQLSLFLEETDGVQFEDFFTQIEELQKLFQSKDLDQQKISEQWKTCQELVVNFTKAFNKYKEAGKAQSEQFQYWSTFLDNLFPILRDLTRSHREGNWQLHLSAVRRALPLFFAFDRTNYSRWVPLYYEDCISLEETFPSIYESFQKGGFVVKHTVRHGSGVPMDQALEKEYNKPAKGQGGIIGITRRKEAVCKWNIIKHEKAHFLKYLQELCSLNVDDEYSLHHDFAQSRTEADEECIEQIFIYISQRTNPFSISSTNEVTNLVTGRQLDKETSSFLINCIKKGEHSYSEFRSSRLENKTVKLFDPIPRIRKVNKVLISNKKIDIKKETISAIRNIDYARLRKYSIHKLLHYELTSTSFFLTKDRFLRKSTKSDLTREIEKNLIKPSPPDVPQDDEPSMIVIDFMAYARKVPVKKLKLKTYGDFVKKLWNTFSYLSRYCNRIDIIFDLYLQHSIKQYERDRRGKLDAINTTISQVDQPLPVDMDRFWSSAENKVRFQQFFIKWMTETYKDSKPVYLGGSHLQDLKTCMKVFEGNQEYVRLLKCDHEEADDRIMFHINHAVTVEKFRRVIVGSPDTDVFVCLVYHFSHWIHFNMKELWVLCGQGDSTRAIPVHDVVNTMDSSVLDVLPAVHALSGCDTTSKVGTKKSALKIAKKSGYEQLLLFAKAPITDEMISSAEKFLVDCISRDNTIETFDKLRYNIYHKKAFQLDLEKLPCTSSSIHLHIKRAYLQCYHWLHVPFLESITLDPTEYGYKVDEDDHLSPQIVHDCVIPSDFPMPCNCIKCAKSTICPCRVRNISCCEFCKCGAGERCKNPFK